MHGHFSKSLFDFFLLEFFISDLLGLYPRCLTKMLNKLDKIYYLIYMLLVYVSVWPDRERQSFLFLILRSLYSCTKTYKKHIRTETMPLPFVLLGTNAKETHAGYLFLFFAEIFSQYTCKVVSRGMKINSYFLDIVIYKYSFYT